MIDSAGDDWSCSQFLQRSSLIQLSLVSQYLVHMLCELGVETLGYLAWFANCHYPVSFAIHLCSLIASINAIQVLDSLPLLSIIT